MSTDPLAPARARSRPSAHLGHGCAKGARQAQHNARSALNALRGSLARCVPQLVHLQHVARSRSVLSSRASASAEPNPALADQHTNGAVRVCGLSRFRGEAVPGRVLTKGAVSLHRPSARAAPLHLMDISGESACTCRRRTHTTGNEHAASACQPLLIQSCTCCRHAAHLGRACGAIQKSPDLAATVSRISIECQYSVLVTNGPGGVTRAPMRRKRAWGSKGPSLATHKHPPK